MAMLPPEKVSRCDYIIFMINNRHTAGLWSSIASFTALQHLRIQQLSYNTLSRAGLRSWGIRHKLCLLFGGTPPPPPLLSWHRDSQSNQHWSEIGKEHLRDAEPGGEWGNFPILHGEMCHQCGNLQKQEVITPATIPHCYQSSMIFSPSYAQTEGLQHL